MTMLDSPHNSHVALPPGERDRLSRRALLQAAAFTPLVLSSLSASGNGLHPQGFWEKERTVWLRRPATREEIRSTYWADGRLITSEYYRLCHFMRDARMERAMLDAQAMGRRAPSDWYATAAQSVVLLDILYATLGWLGYFGIETPLIVLSAFRHSVTNQKTERAARNSAHLRAGAADIVIPGVTATSVANYGVWLKAGGVGFYPAAGFTHVDDGRKRVWRG